MKILTNIIQLPSIVQVDTSVLPDIWPDFCKKERIRVSGVLMYENVIKNQKLWPAFGVLSEGIKKGAHQRTDTIIDSTSGNFGVALAYAIQEARKHFPRFSITRVIAVVPVSLPQGKQKRLQEAGVDLVFAKNSLDAMDIARELSSRHGYWYTEQYWNQANSRSYLRVGEHIGALVPYVRAVSCGVGSGGSLSGIALGMEGCMARDFSSVHFTAVVVEPGFKVPGVRDSFGLEPGTLPWRRYAHDVRYLGSDTALKWSAVLWDQGLPVGPSSGFALAGGLLSLHCLWTLQRLHRLRSIEGIVDLVVLFPDTREPYQEEYEEQELIFAPC